MTRMILFVLLLVAASSTLLAQPVNPEPVIIQIQRSLDQAYSGVDDLMPASDADKLVFDYRLQNTSATEVQLGQISLTNIVNCAVLMTRLPDSEVGAHGETRMILEVTPVEGGLFSFTVSTTVDDKPYNFAVQATITALLHSVGDGRKHHDHCSTGTESSWALLAGVGALLATLALRRRTS